MFDLWKKISLIGVCKTAAVKPRNIILSNQIAAILFIACLVVAFMLYFFFGRIVSPLLTITTGFAITLVWLFHYYSFVSISRLYIVYFMPIATVAISIIAKSKSDNQIAQFEYFDSRLILLAMAMLPFILFEYYERMKLVAGLLIGFLLILFYDPIHNLFNVGYYQSGYDSTRYDFIDYIMVITYGVIGFATLTLKSKIYNAEKDNEILIDDLKKSHSLLERNNEELQLLNKEISERNKAIQSQAEELKNNQEQIFNASHIIAQQREELETKNRMLEVRLKSQDKSLLETNTELVKRNNELRQFGYTVSHNLRGPIASLLGLANLFDEKNAYPNNLNIIKHIHEVTLNLDTIIKDLNYIVEIRKNAALVAEPIELKKELNVVLSSLKESIIKSQANIHIDLADEKINGIKAYIHSIFHNLIENSIKFRSAHRPLEIKISSLRQNGNIFIKVEDNGIGFDITRHYEDIFHLYKRFHSNAPGRGLGLYLTKLQVENLGGEIMVNSAINIGTTFTISFPHSPDGSGH